MTGDSASRSARGVYGISVVAELTGIGAQTLRLYDRWGLVSPARTGGGTRRYSDDDLERLNHISELVERGVNLAGIGQILDLETKNTELAAHNSQLRSAEAGAETDAPDETDPPHRAPAADS